MNSSSLNEIFTAVKTRIAERINSLNGLNALNTKISFEGWLKVEAINALGQRVDRIQNKGSDLKLNDGSKIELKASMDRIHKGYFYHKKGNKYVDPVLLIAGDNIARLKLFAQKYDMAIIEYESLNDSLLIAIVKP
jgi:hypothetical protein